MMITTTMRMVLFAWEIFGVAVEIVVGMVVPFVVPSGSVAGFRVVVVVFSISLSMSNEKMSKGLSAESSR